VSEPVSVYVLRLMGDIELSPEHYRRVGSQSPRFRRGLAKWLYFLRHPILAAATYQKAYPDDPEKEPEFRERLARGALFGLAVYWINRLTG
jgi:hypothetical protein